MLFLPGNVKRPSRGASAPAVLSIANSSISGGSWSSLCIDSSADISVGNEESAVSFKPLASKYVRQIIAPMLNVDYGGAHAFAHDSAETIGAHVRTCQTAFNKKVPLFSRDNISILLYVHFYLVSVAAENHEMIDGRGRFLYSSSPCLRPGEGTTAKSALGRLSRSTPPEDGITIPWSSLSFLYSRSCACHAFTTAWVPPRPSTMTVNSRRSPP
jgi:hypothetical protein